MEINRPISSSRIAIGEVNDIYWGQNGFCRFAERKFNANLGGDNRRIVSDIKAMWAYIDFHRGENSARRHKKTILIEI